MYGTDWSDRKDGYNENLDNWFIHTNHQGTGDTDEVRYPYANQTY